MDHWRIAKRNMRKYFCTRMLRFTETVNIYISYLIALGHAHITLEL